MNKKYIFSYEYSEYQQQFGEKLSIEQVAFVAGVKPNTVKKLISLEIIEAKKDEVQTYIHVRHIPKLKKIIRLHYDLGIGWNSMEVVSDLLDRIEELERKLKELN